jgi:hypothetical protein
MLYSRSQARFIPPRSVRYPSSGFAAQQTYTSRPGKAVLPLPHCWRLTSIFLPTRCSESGSAEASTVGAGSTCFRGGSGRRSSA